MSTKREVGPNKGQYRVVRSALRLSRKHFTAPLVAMLENPKAKQAIQYVARRGSTAPVVQVKVTRIKHGGLGDLRVSVKWGINRGHDGRELRRKIRRGSYRAFVLK